MRVVDLAPGRPLVPAVKIKAPGVLTQQRLGSNPELATVAESANGCYLVGSLGLLAPGGTPDAIVAKINAPFVAFFKPQQSA